jgi:hypothetical protein
MATKESAAVFSARVAVTAEETKITQVANAKIVGEMLIEMASPA